MDFANRELKLVSADRFHTASRDHHVGTLIPRMGPTRMRSGKRSFDQRTQLLVSELDSPRLRRQLQHLGPSLLKPRQNILGEARIFFEEERITLDPEINRADYSRARFLRQLLIHRTQCGAVQLCYFIRKPS